MGWTNRPTQIWNSPKCLKPRVYGSKQRKMKEVNQVKTETMDKQNIKEKTEKCEKNMTSSSALSPVKKKW
jgi:hypothetical protein